MFSHSPQHAGYTKGTYDTRACRQSPIKGTYAGRVDARGIVNGDRTEDVVICDRGNPSSSQSSRITSETVNGPYSPSLWKIRYTREIFRVHQRRRDILL